MIQFFFSRNDYFDVFISLVVSTFTNAVNKMTAKRHFHKLSGQSNSLTLREKRNCLFHVVIVYLRKKRTTTKSGQTMHKKYFLHTNGITLNYIYCIHCRRSRALKTQQFMQEISPLGWRVMFAVCRASGHY